MKFEVKFEDGSGRIALNPQFSITDNGGIGQVKSLFFCNYIKWMKQLTPERFHIIEKANARKHRVIKRFLKFSALICSYKKTEATRNKFFSH